MSNYIESVREFHQLFNHPINTHNGTEVDRKTAVLRMNLLFEEIHELSVALGVESDFIANCVEKTANSKEDVRADSVDRVEIIDALADIQYVLSGAVLALGFTDSFDTVFDEVHRSNMTKLCSTIDEAQQTKEWYITEKGFSADDVSIKTNGNKFIVYRVSDNKILKNKFYSSADIKKLI